MRPKIKKQVVTLRKTSELQKTLSCQIFISGTVKHIPLGILIFFFLQVVKLVGINRGLEFLPEFLSILYFCYSMKVLSVGYSKTPHVVSMLRLREMPLEIAAPAIPLVAADLAQKKNGSARAVCRASTESASRPSPAAPPWDCRWGRRRPRPNRRRSPRRWTRRRPRPPPGGAAGRRTSVRRRPPPPTPGDVRRPSGRWPVRPGGRWRRGSIGAGGGRRPRRPRRRPGNIWRRRRRGGRRIRRPARFWRPRGSGGLRRRACGKFVCFRGRRGGKGRRGILGRQRDARRGQRGGLRISCPWPPGRL
mmetsp:Transcript_2976/g.5574  ORF Transcript_2976/g.5574 Transcript_2976/m.5574 type:complete len:305 (-) Transcript_2976:745-1659(-)